MCKFHEAKNQNATNFTNRNEHTTSLTTKYQQKTSSMIKISFTRRKINVQVSRREKSIWNNCHKKIITQDSRKKLAYRSFMNIFSVRRDKSMYKFHEEKNQNAKSFTNKISRQRVLRTKITPQKVP